MGTTEPLDPEPSQLDNAATRTFVSTLGVLLGLSSIDHGILETLQGNRPTPGYLVKALGPGHSWTLWREGAEPAFTLVHNFLLTGVLATVCGLLLIMWSLRSLRRGRGATTFLLLSVASFLVGGGLAQVLLFTLNWAVATRMRASLGFWRWWMPPFLRRALAGLWPWTLAAGALLFLAALEIAGWGYFPGLAPDTEILTAVLWRLAAAIIFAFVLSILCAFAYDIERRGPGA